MCQELVKNERRVHLLSFYQMFTRAFTLRRFLEVIKKLKEAWISSERKLLLQSSHAPFARNNSLKLVCLFQTVKEKKLESFLIPDTQKEILNTNKLINRNFTVFLSRNKWKNCWVSLKTVMKSKYLIFEARI